MQLSNQSGLTRIVRGMTEGHLRSLTRPNLAKQLERRNWAAGYADGYIDGLEEAWARINAEIEGRPMPPPEKDEFRKGLLLACKLIAENT